MYKFGKKSLEKRSQLDERLQRVLDVAIQLMDFAILEGTRDEATQNEYFRLGKSKVQFPNSKHNQSPSKAVDIVPYPIDWADKERFSFLAGLIIGIGKAEGVEIRWGGDWNQNGKFHDQDFHDLPHLEIVE
jgi:hypothetical protein